MSVFIRRGAAAVTGLFLGIGVGILAADGRWWPIIAIVPFSAALGIIVRGLAPAEDRGRIAAVVALAFSLHIAVAVALYTGSLALGHGGFIPGDDIAYAQVADNFVRYVRGQEIPRGMGPPYWGGNDYLFGTWVYIQSAIFFIVGPEVLVPILLNGTFALVMALIVFDMARGLFGRRSGLLTLGLTALYPSLVLWSSLNLKDALALLLTALCLWGLMRFQRRPRWSAFALAFAVLVPMVSLRPYLFFGLAVVIPPAVALTPGFVPPLVRWRWTGIALLASALLLFLTQSGGIRVGPQMLQALEEQREASGLTARSRFVDAPPVIAKEGDSFVVAALSALPTPEASTTSPSASPEASPSPASRTPVVSTSPAVATVASATPSPATIHVRPNTRIVVVTSTPNPVAAGSASSHPTTPGIEAPAVSVTPDIVYVRPGDVVVVGSPSTTPAPDPRRIVPGGEPVQLRDRQTQDGLVLARTLAYVPRGLAYAFLAPFPWQIERSLDLAVAPEMILWYIVLVAATVTLARNRGEWRRFFALAAVPVGLLLALSLAEGNVGSLYRHRAMTVPWILLLASPTLVAIGAWAFALRARLGPIRLAAASDVP